LNDVQPNSENQKIIQKLFGLSLLPETKYNVAFFFCGEGGTGKSVCLYVLEKFIGSNNCCCVPLSNFSQKFSLYPLTVSLLNLVGELPTHSEGSFETIEGIFKDVTDGGLIPVERKNRDPEKARVIARNVFAGNSLPYFKDRSNAVWDRLRIIPFNVRFRNTPRQNPNLKLEIIEQELPAILNWALLGLVSLIHKNKTFPESPDGLKLKDEHRKFCDIERNFLEENYKESLDNHIESQLIYDRYRDWNRANGHNSKSQANFNQSVKRVFPKAFIADIRNPDRMRVWQNITQK